MVLESDDCKVKLRIIMLTLDNIVEHMTITKGEEHDR
jgi:hypothetical protein